MTPVTMALWELRVTRNQNVLNMSLHQPQHTGLTAALRHSYLQDITQHLTLLLGWVLLQLGQMFFQLGKFSLKDFILLFKAFLGVNKSLV